MPAHLLLYLMASLALNCSWTKAPSLLKESFHTKTDSVAESSISINHIKSNSSNEDAEFQLAIVILLSTQIFLKLAISFGILLTIFSCNPNFFFTPVTPEPFSIFLHASNRKDILCVRSEALNAEWSPWWSRIFRRNL